ncbi:MAG: hypothetical protein ACXWZI_16405 [Mycobacterium sp.]
MTPTTVLRTFLAPPVHRASGHRSDPHQTYWRFGGARVWCGSGISPSPLIRCGVEGGVGVGTAGSVGGRGHHVVKAMALCPLTRRVEHAGLDVQDVDHAFGADDLGDAHSFST